MKVIARAILVISFVVLGYSVAGADVKVFDAKNQFLGYLVDYDTIFLPSTNLLIHVNLTDGNVVRYTPLFESSDCTGTAYTEASTINELMTNGTNFFIAKRLAPVTKTIHSYIRPYGTCIQDTYQSSVIPLEQFTGTLPFSLPVALPIRYEFAGISKSVATMNDWGIILFFIVSGIISIYHLRKQKAKYKRGSLEI